MLLSIRKSAGLICAALLILCQAGCSSTPQERPTPTPHVINITPIPVARTSEPEQDSAPEQTPQAENTELDFSATENREGELVFTVTAEDFITAYNEQYEADYGNTYLPPLAQWRHFSYKEAPHSDYKTEYYSYPAEISGPYIPTISLYIPSDSSYIQEIALDLDHHGFQEWAYDVLLEKYLYTMRMVFPDVEDNRLTELFQTLYTLAEQSEICFFGAGLGAQITPPILYRCGNIGIYPCYAGGMLYINIIPVTQDYLDTLAAKNSQLYEIP